MTSMTDESRRNAVQAPAAGVAHAVGDTARYLTFLLEGATYAIPVGHVLRVIDCRSVVRVIRAPGHQRGVLNYDGIVVPVLDLRRHLGIESKAPRAFSMVIVTQVLSDTGAEVVGFLVERVLAVTELDVEAALAADPRAPASRLVAPVPAVPADHH